MEAWKKIFLSFSSIVFLSTKGLRFSSRRERDGLVVGETVRETTGCRVKEAAFFLVRSGEIRSIKPDEI